MDDLGPFCGLNPRGPDHGKRGHGNRTVTSRYGPGKVRRMLRCRTGKARVSERKGTPRFDARLSAEKVTAVRAHVAEGIGTRKTARRIRAHPGTVARYTRRAGDHAAQRHDELVPFSPEHRGAPVRREVGARRQEAEELCRRCPRQGDGGDHVALDPETRLVVSPVVGKRTADATHARVRDFRPRTGGRAMRRMTSDEYPVYAEPIRGAYGHVVAPPRAGRPGRPRNPHVAVPPAITCATVHKEKENNRVVRASTRVVLGAAAVALAVAASAVGRVVSTSVVGRHNGTDRNRCRRKARKTYALSKDWDTHRAATVFRYFSYNFGWPVRTLRVKGERGRWQKRTPAMAAGLADRVWSMSEWVAYPARHMPRK
ncbi:hypothetical protein VT84_28050 [Gemmata sp. SH-PL17]|uniref:hypothetical protein n=1 Tax=Gemmata sp. SH-PL17 TaxID=1630693 RepID=UPI00078CF29E|nr:hypothetical protein [Gemmata sp. SH-PL17]AMV28288.1 hypothetical protein VT84_28050 [Gemmata sp. SH-PL17]